MPSPLFRNMAATVKTHDYFSDLRLIRLRSDKVHRSDIELCQTIAPPSCVIATGLATTETGTIRMNLLDCGTKILGNEAPIGFPVEDKEVFLIADDGKRVGFNEVGEIAVRSKYLSPGVLERSRTHRIQVPARCRKSRYAHLLHGRFGIDASRWLLDS